MHNELIFVFSYNREEMLRKVMVSLDGYNYFVVDDGSDFTIDDPRFIKHEHHGREKWWRLWDSVLKKAGETDHSLIVFTTDDFLDIDMKAIQQRHEQFKGSPYFYNIIRDKRDHCWGHFPLTQVDENTTRIGFIDCGFFCNRSALDKLGYYINPVGESRFKNPLISTGVGLQLTARVRKLGIPMYRPVKSLAFHGLHESKMLPRERVIHPVPSIH